MSHRPSHHRPFVIAAAAVFIFSVLAFSQSGSTAPETAKPAVRANYELASRFTPAKVGKLVFDTAVQPHWLETGDRFWYGWETSRGRSFSIVDPLRASKAPLFDNAKMAALLTGIVLTP